MAEAEVGDDVYKDDPTVNHLEEMAAEQLGFEAALFTASGTQANLIALLSHCQRGDEYIVGQTAHTYKYEGGGAAVFGSIQPQPIAFEADGTLDLQKIAAKIKPDDDHFARTRLIALENTQGGKALPLDYLQAAGQFAREHGLHLHMDGARLMNAAVECNLPASALTAPFDSATLCLSKGLGAPIGSLVCGSSEFIREAKKWRKMAGGGMRQAGIIAAAGIYALENNVLRLKDDHRRARRLAEELQAIDWPGCTVHPAQTNMVFIDMDTAYSQRLAAFLLRHDVLINHGSELRLVVHLGIDDDDIERAVTLIKEFVNRHK